MARKPKSKNRRDRQPAPQPPGFASRHRRLLLALLLFVLAAAAYYPSLHNGYVNYDDPEYVSSNPHVLAGLSWQNVAWAFRDTATTFNWHPLTWLSLMLDSQLFGPKPWGHHFVNLLFHALNAAMLFVVLCRMTGATGRCFFVAALFGLHPLHVQSVAWISERKDVLSALFWILALWAYARYAAEINGRRRIFYGLAFGCFTLGLMAKPMLVTLPFTLLLLDYWPLDRWRAGATGRLLVEKLPFFALAALACVITIMVQRPDGATSDMGRVAFSGRLENASISYCGYVGKLLLPLKLAVFYPFLLHPAPGKVGLSIVLVVGATAGAILLARRRPYLPVGWLWFVGTLVPVIGLVQVGEQGMADRYAYVPSIGFFIAAVWGMCELAGHWHFPAPVLPAVGGVILVAAIADTRREIGFWADSETLFRRDIAVAGGSATGHLDLGAALGAKSDLDGQLNEYQQAVALEPSNAVARNDLGSALIAKGQFDDARGQLEEAVRLQPNYPVAHYNLGFALLKLERPEEAAPQFEQTVKQMPTLGDAHYMLGCLLVQNGRLDEAIAQLKDAARLLPEIEAVHRELGAALLKKGQVDEAEGPLRDAIRLKPADPDAHNLLGVALIREKKVDEAISEFREAVALKRDFAEAQANLNLALKRKGQ